MNNKKGYINLGGSNQNSAVRPEAAVTGSKKHGINWNEGPARAKSTGNPQGQWAESDLDFATKKANTLAPGESGYFDLPAVLSLLFICQMDLLNLLLEYGKETMAQAHGTAIQRCNKQRKICIWYLQFKSEILR